MCTNLYFGQDFLFFFFLFFHKKDDCISEHSVEDGDVYIWRAQDRILDRMRQTGIDGGW